jgi:hypothetical protein
LSFFYFSLGLLSVPDDYWPCYSVMAIFAVIPIIIGPVRYRLWGAVALALSVALILGDVESGKLFREKIQRIRERISEDQHSTNAP